MRVIASTDSNQFDGRYFAMEKLYCRANKRVVATYFEMYFAIHHQWGEKRLLPPPRLFELP